MTSHPRIQPDSKSAGDLKQEAQDAIIAALVNAAFIKDDAGHPEVAHIIRLEATKVAKRWGLSEVSGLPATWKRSKKVPSYD